MNLTTMRTRVRNTIKDLDAAAYYFVDAEVDAAITRALNDYCEQAGPPASTTLSGTGATRIFTIGAGVTDYLYALAVEHPLDEDPPKLLRFQERPPRTLRVIGAMPASGADNIRVWYSQLILAADATWAIPVTDEHIVDVGAAYYLTLAGARFSSTRLNSSQAVPRQLAQLADHWSDQYKANIARLANRTEYPSRMPSWTEA